MPVPTTPSENNYNLRLIEKTEVTTQAKHKEQTDTSAPNTQKHLYVL